MHIDNLRVLLIRQLLLFLNYKRCRLTLSIQGLGKEVKDKITAVTGWSQAKDRIVQKVRRD